MATAYYPDIKWYYYNAAGAAWVDITGYVLTKSGVSGHWGMRSNKYTDRLAATGEMRMLLDNASGVFDPDDASVLTGWALNAIVKLVVTYDSVDYVRFRGKVTRIEMSDPNTYEHTASVTVSDWMYNAYNKKIDQLSVQTFKRGGQVVDSIVDAVGVTPLATAYSVGDYEFPAAFDSMTITTTAATELNKVVLSENGYFYCRHDKVNGETLVFEAESDRNGLRTVSKIPKLKADSGFVLKAGSATDYVLMAGSATDKLILNETADADFDGIAQGYSRTHGDNVLNKVTVTAYPKRVDTTEQTLYSLGTPLMLAPGETKTITVKYQNATTKESCNAITSLCSQPVATTDYLMNTKKEGTGTNITANLTVSVIFYTAEAEVTVTNASAYNGHVTRLYLKGYGVYQDASIKAIAEKSASQTAYGVQELNIEQRYQRDVISGQSLAFRMANVEKDPRTKLDSVRFIANKSSTAMYAFCVLDIGDMVRVTESTLNLDDDFYIQGVEFSIQEGDVIMYKWILGVSIALLAVACTPVALEFTNTAGQYVMFPSSCTSGTTQKSITFDLYLDSFGDTGLPAYLITKTNLPTADSFGWEVRLGTGTEQLYYFQYTEGSNYITWGTGASSVAVETVYHVAILYDNSSIANNPTIYINGVEASLTESGSTAYAPVDADDAPLNIGPSFLRKSIDGKMSKVRVHNVILTAEEVATINGGSEVTRGLIFSAPTVPTDETADYYDVTLTNEIPLFDEVEFKVGIPQGSPICREIT